MEDVVECVADAARTGAAKDCLELGGGSRGMRAWFEEEWRRFM